MILIFEEGDCMNNNSLRNGIITFVVILCIFLIIGTILNMSTPKCDKLGCDNKPATGSNYCYMHKTYPKSSSSSTGSSSTKSNSSTGSGSTKSNSSTGSGSAKSSVSSSSSSKNYSSTKSSSSGSSSSNHKYYNSYDDGYDDIYENDDYDEDRYNSDPDYAAGVDDAMEDVDW